jgi:hypothetical protein
VNVDNSKVYPPYMQTMRSAETILVREFKAQLFEIYMNEDRCRELIMVLGEVNRADVDPEFEAVRKLIDKVEEANRHWEFMDQIGDPPPYGTTP